MIKCNCCNNVSTFLSETFVFCIFLSNSCPIEKFHKLDQIRLLKMETHWHVQWWTIQLSFEVLFGNSHKWQRHNCSMNQFTLKVYEGTKACSDAKTPPFTESPMFSDELVPFNCPSRFSLATQRRKDNCSMNQFTLKACSAAKTIPFTESSCWT